MALALTVEKEKNAMYTDFVDAYWYLQDISYNTTQLYFQLCVYPSREAKNMRNEQITERFPIGSATEEIFKPLIYQWNGLFNIADVFPNGIPLDVDEQKSTIYTFIKTYTGLPFKDVLEG